MKRLDASKILGGKERPWFDVLWLFLDRRMAADWFQHEPLVAWEDGFGEADYWAVEFDCGLKLCFEFVHLEKVGRVLATEPVPQHAKRHLGHWRDQLQEIPPETFELDRSTMIERFAATMPELMQLRSHQVWCRDRNGNPAAVGEPTSERDALCWWTVLQRTEVQKEFWVTMVSE